MSATAIEPAFRTYFGVFDGSKGKDFDQDLAGPFNSLFHDDLVIDVGNGKTMNKAGHKDAVTNFLAVGAKSEVQEFKVIDDETVEYKVRLVNDKMDKVGHSMCKVKDGKLVKIDIVDPAAYTSVLESTK